MKQILEELITKWPLLVLRTELGMDIVNMITNFKNILKHANSSGNGASVTAVLALLSALLHSVEHFLYCMYFVYV